MKRPSKYQAVDGQEFHVVTRDSVFETTPEDPAIVVDFDEIDVPAAIPGAAAS